MLENANIVPVLSYNIDSHYSHSNDGMFPFKNCIATIFPMFKFSLNFGYERKFSLWFVFDFHRWLSLFMSHLCWLKATLLIRKDFYCNRQLTKKIPWENHFLITFYLSLFPNTVLTVGSWRLWSLPFHWNEDH